MSRNSVSLIIPAFNEESYLGPTLEAINRALSHPNVPAELRTEVLVVDNGSTDATAEIARSFGASVVNAPRGNVAMARNAGAHAASGDVLVFVDADTHWPVSMLSYIVEVMRDDRCIGGAVEVEYRPRRAIIRAYLWCWRILGKLFRMAQGATQFCTAKAFASMDGYDESVYMGEDVDFHARLRNYAKSDGDFIALIKAEKVVPSCRRFDNWPVWKTLLLTNPITCLLFSKIRWTWRGWYSDPPR